MKQASLAFALVLGLTLTGGTAFAQLLDTNAGLDVEGNVGGSGAGVSADVDAEMRGAATSTDSAAEEDETASSQTDLGSTFSLSITRDDLDENTEYAVTDADFVRSEASLESYAAATARADERLESIVIEGNRLDMEYRKPAKFLWIIPSSILARVSIDAGQDVTVRYPWYSFLMGVDESRADLAARLQAEIDAINSSMQLAAASEVSGEASSGIQADPEIRRWARIMESAYVTVSGDARVDASAQAAS